MIKKDQLRLHIYIDITINHFSVESLCFLCFCVGQSSTESRGGESEFAAPIRLWVRHCLVLRVGETMVRKPSFLHVPRAFQDAPRLQLALYSLDVALEEDEIHYPAVEEPLRYYPQQHPQALVLEDVCHDADACVDDEEDEVVEEYLHGIA